MCINPIIDNRGERECPDYSCLFHVLNSLGRYPVWHLVWFQHESEEYSKKRNLWKCGREGRRALILRKVTRNCHGGIRIFCESVFPHAAPPPTHPECTLGKACCPSSSSHLFPSPPTGSRQARVAVIVMGFITRPTLSRP